MEGSFYGPLGYSGWFPWAALGLLVLVASWYAFVLLSTRRPRSAPEPAATAPSAPPSDIARLKEDYLRRIDAVARDAQGGARSARAAHQELSVLLRGFTRDVSGVDAPRMTLAELRSVDVQAGNISAVTAAISRFYPAEFAAAPDRHAPAVAESAETAREVVRSWN